MASRQNAASRVILAATVVTATTAITQLSPPETFDDTTAEAAANDETGFVPPTAPTLTAASRERMRTEAQDELRRYLDFAPGWDGYDGLPFSAALVDRATALIDLLCDRVAFAGAELHELTPGPISDGRIDIEAATDSRHLTITLNPDEPMTFVGRQEQRSGNAGVVESVEQHVGRWLEWLAGADRVPTLVREASAYSWPRAPLESGLQAGPA